MLPRLGEEQPMNAEGRPKDRMTVVVGIPTLNGPKRLDRCLCSVLAHSPGARVIVCDDGSFPDELEANKAVVAAHGVPMLMNQARLGVAESWNRLTRHAAAHFGAEVMALVNDDVEVVADWLDALLFSVSENPHAGMVGLSSWVGARSDIFSPPRTPDYYEATMRHGDGMLSSCGYCFAFSVEKFEKVGGFDSGYFCFYEEIDLGVSFLAHGWPSYMLDRPLVLHQGGATTSDQRNLDAPARLAQSRARFRSKWTSIAHQRELYSGRQWSPARSWNTMLRNWVD